MDLTIAKAIAAAINEEDGYHASAWQGDRGSRPVRVYIRRYLSRGRKQEMGHLYIKDGYVDASGMVRRKAWARDLARDIAAELTAPPTPADSGAMPVSAERTEDIGDDHLPNGAPAPRGSTAAPYALPSTTATTEDEPFWHDPEDPDWDPTRVPEVQ